MPSFLSGRTCCIGSGVVVVRLGLSTVGIRYRVAGEQYIQHDRAAVYCVNHASNIEPPLLYLVLAALHPRLRILYKAELRAAIPVLRSAFDVVGFVPVERSNREQSMRAIDAAANALRHGNSFLIFPEGTRSRTSKLLPFKKGGFIMAIKGGAEIVPMAIQGTRAAMRKGVRSFDRLRSPSGLVLRFPPLTSRCRNAMS